MFVFLILPVLVSGFIVCNHNLSYYYKLHRFEGQYLYLKSAHLGLMCLMAAFLSGLALSLGLPDEITVAGRSISLALLPPVDQLLGDMLSVTPLPEVHRISWLLVLSVSTLVIAYLSSWLNNLRLAARSGSFDKAKILLMGGVLRDSPIDKLFFDSYIQSRPLLITLETGKVYVGTISELGEPNESEGMDQEISIIPLMSGYRNRNEHRVNFVTDYQAVNSDLNIVIRQDKVITASWFDFAIYSKLNPRKSPEPSKGDVDEGNPSAGAEVSRPAVQGSWLKRWARRICGRRCQAAAGNKSVGR